MHIQMINVTIYFQWTLNTLTLWSLSFDYSLLLLLRIVMISTKADCLLITYGWQCIVPKITVECSLFSLWQPQNFFWKLQSQLWSIVSFFVHSLYKSDHTWPSEVGTVGTLWSKTMYSFRNLTSIVINSYRTIQTNIVYSILDRLLDEPRPTITNHYYLLMIANLETVCVFFHISSFISQITEIHVYNYSKLIVESQFHFQFEFENERPINLIKHLHSCEWIILWILWKK